MTVVVNIQKSENPYSIDLRLYNELLRSTTVLEGHEHLPFKVYCFCGGPKSLEKARRQLNPPKFQDGPTCCLGKPHR